MMRLHDSRVIASDPRELRTIAISFLTVGKPFHLLAFRAADTHIHALVLDDFVGAGEFARRVEISMQRRLRPGVGFSEVHRKRVLDQAHLRNTFNYVLRNPARHDAQMDPLGEASNLPDLMGLRLLGEWTLDLTRAALPRVQVRELVDHLPVRSAGARVDERLLAESAEAAAGLLPGGLAHRAPSARQGGLPREAAIAAVHALPEETVAATARRLALSSRTVERFRTVEPDAALLRATRGQLNLRSAWAAARRATRDRVA